MILINKKCISPIVATALLIVVAVVSVVGFQNWFKTYQTGIELKVETGNGFNFNSGIDRVSGSDLYFKNPNQNIQIYQVKIGGFNCNISGNYTSKLVTLDVSKCLSNLSKKDKYEISVQTNNRIYSKFGIIKPIPLVLGPPPNTNNFTSDWNTSENSTSGSSLANQIHLPLESTGTYNFKVFWGDGTNNTITTWNQAETTHTYSTQGVYEINISGIIKGFRFNSVGDKLKLYSISAWGPLNVGNNGGYFAGAQNFNFIGTDNLDLTGTTNFSYMFSYSTKFNGLINGWDTSNVTDMSYMFYSDTYFNQPLNNWDTSKVTNMNVIFYRTIFFNQSLNNWNTSNVKSMDGVFFSDYSFNQPLNNWDTSNVTDMSLLFSFASSFNKSLNNWNTSKVVSMVGMFYQATSFNQNISSWNVSNVSSCLNFNSSPSWNLPKPNFTNC